MTRQSAILGPRAFFAGQSLDSSANRSLSAVPAARRSPAWARGILLLAAAVMMLGVAAQAQYSLAPSWYQQSPAANPGQRYIHSMAYDAGHAQVVLFGGFNSTYANDTWLWNGTNWTQANPNPASVPSPRAAPAMVYDPVHHNVVLFGGFVNAGTRLNDTWLWDGTNWTNVTPATVTATNNPSPRSNAGIAFDAALGEVVLFGGTNGSGLADTWLWNGTAWTQWNNPVPSNNPAPRAEPGMAYDAATDQVVLFGGNVNSVDMNDTWTWNGTAWSQQSISTPPPARAAQGMDYDAALGEVVMFGGQSGNNDLNDTWAYNGTNWTQVTVPASTTPAARVVPNAMVYDSLHQQLVMFGGYTGAGQLSDTWEFGLPGNFGNVNVCPSGATTPAPCSKTLSFTVNVSGLQNLGTPQVLTQGTSGLDFTLSSGSTCTGVGSTGSCVVNATFTPIAPGSRTGAVQLMYPGGVGVALSIPVYGIGQGPEAGILPGAPSTVNTGSFTLNQPKGVLVDAAGNLFISDTATQQVIKIAPSGAISTVGVGLQFPQGMAEDGAGNLYIADNNLNEIVEVPAGCTTSSCQQAIGGNLGSQLGVAVDGAGDIFIGDFEAGEVVESPAGCTAAACQIVVYPPRTGSHPNQITADAAGDLYVADFGLKTVVEVPAGCTNASCQIAQGGGWNQPDGVAVDAAGNVYVADAGVNQLIEVPAGCASVTCKRVLSVGANTGAVTVDATGDLFYDDVAHAQVLELSRSQTEALNFPTTVLGTTSTASATLQNIGNQPLQAESPGLLTVSGASYSNTPGPGTPPDCSATSTLAPAAECDANILFSPQSYIQPNTGTAIFSDNSLNAASATQTAVLFGMGAKPVQSFYEFTVAEIGSGSGTVTDISGAINCSETNGTPAGTCAASLPSSALVTLTATASGTSTFLGWGGACASFGTNATCYVLITQAENVTASFVNPNFGNINVCPANINAIGPCSSTLPVTYNLASTTTIGAITVVTQGVIGLDFSLGIGSTCIGKVTAGNSCSVNVNFAPLAPGLRMGAVQLFDNNGNLLESTPIYGIGQGPVTAFGPGTQTTLAANLSSGASGVAVDASGNVFVAGGNGAVKITPSNVQLAIPVSGSTSGFYDVALDGAGNVYLADSNNNRIVEVTPAGVQTTVPATGLSFPSGVKVDGSGNLFITDVNNNRVVKVTPSGVQTTVPTTGLVRPYYPAVDAAGDVFFLDDGHERVLKVTPAGVQSTVPFGGLIAINGVAVDAAGDVFVSDQILNAIFEITPSGVQTTVPTSGLNVPAGLTVDAAGDVFIADSGLASLVEVNRSQVPSFSFALAEVGSTSVDSPQSLVIQNVGNQPLTGSLALNLGGNFTQNVAPDCSTAFPLAPGATCTDSFSFTPQSATFFSGTAVLTDNDLNFSSVTETITLSGTGAVGGVAGTVAVPNVVGQVQTAVYTPITTAGLALGSVSTASSQSVPSGSVISQSPAAGAQVAVGTPVNLLVSSGVAQPVSPNPLSLNNNYFLTGDYVSAGVTLRGTGKGGMATGSITIPSYSTSPTQGVPDGADIIDAFLYWETLENTPSASSTNGTFNGYQIVGQQIGNDIPNYVDGAVTGTIRAYRADVNLYLPDGANGIRFAAGTYKVALPDSGGSGFPLTEGASLVLIYRVLSPNFPLKSVVIYDGSAAPTVLGAQVVKGFYDAAGGGNATGKNTNLFASNGAWNNSVNTLALGSSSQFSATLNPGAAYAAVILSTPVNNSDNDGILDAWKAGPAAGDFHAGQPGYYDVKTGTWVGLPGAKHGQKDLFVQLDYMCGNVLASGSCDPAQENLFPSPDTDGNDPLAMVQQAFANSGVQLHLQIGNAVPETTCVDSATTGLCQFPNQPGVIGWKNSLEFSKLYPRNLLACITGGDCTTRFPYGQKDSYHYVLMGHSLAIPAYNTRYGTLTSINVVNGITTIGTVDRGSGINACPSRITISGVLGDPALNGVYNTTGCADTKTITLATPGVPNYTYPNNTLPEPVIGLTSGTITSISGYSDLGGADSAVTLGLWLTAPNQDMSKRANVLAGTIFHEIGHTLGLSHGGLYYDTPNSYVPNFEANCKPNYQSVMNYLFQLDLVGPNKTVAFSNQTLNTLNETTAGSVTQLTDPNGNAATFPTSAWYVPYTANSTVTPATLHCDGTPLNGESGYRVDAPIAPITPPWSNGQDLDFIGTLQTEERGYNDLANMDLRQVGATGGEFASLASILSFGNAASPLNVSAGGNVTLGSGGTIALGSGGNVTLGSGGNVTLGSGGTITLGSGGNITLGSGGNVTLGSGGTITPGSSGTITLGSGGNVTLGSGGTITLGSGGNITLGSGGTVTLGSGGTITLGSGGTVTIPSTGGSYSIDGNGGTITLGSGGNVTLGSGGNVTLGSGGTITLGSGGNVTLGSGGNVTLGSGGTITLGSGGNVTLGSGGNVTLGSGGTITLGSGGTITLGSGGNVTLGSGGTVTLGSGGELSEGSGGNVTLGSGGEATLGAGGTVTLGSGGNVTLGSGGNVTLGSGGTITLGSGGNITLGSGGNVTLGSGGTITLGSGGNITLGSGGTVTLGSGGTITLGSGGLPIVIGAGGSYTFTGSGGTITLGSGGNVTLGSGGNVTLGSGGTITLGSGGNITLGSGGNVTLGSGGTITLGSGGTITLGSGGNVTLGSGGVVTLGSGGSVTLGSGSETSLGSVSNITPGSGGPSSTELTYETANSIVRPPSLPTETSTPSGVRVTWKAPAFGVVQTYIVYRSSNGATPIVIGSVSGVNGNPPATEFTDTNPDLTSKTVVYTISTILVPDTTGGTPRQSPPSVPAVLKNDQTITLGPLPSSVTLANPPTVTATAMSSGVPNGLQVVFSATGACSIGSQSIANNVSSAAVTLNGTGSCTVTASQPGTTAYNAANSVSGTFMVLSNSSGLQSQTIHFATLPNVQYGNTFSLTATSSSGLPVSFTASGPCTTGGSIKGVGLCSITASAPGNSTYSAASLTQQFAIYPAVLKVTATSLNVAYGQPLPALTYSYSGFVSPDTASVVSGVPALSTTATSTSTPGSYPITVSTGTLAAANYDFLYVSGTLTVNAANVSLGISNSTQTYQQWTNLVIGPIYTGSRVPTGTVTLYDNGTAITTLTLGGNGKAYYTASPFSVGPNVLTATYSGNPYFPAGSSSPVTITVLPAPVNFQASCWGAQVYGSAYQCTVNLSASTTTVPGGNITYSFDGGTPVSVPIVNGNAPFTLPAIPAAGNHKLVLSYAAQGNFAAAGPITESFTTAQGQTQLQAAPSSYNPASGSSLTISGTATTPTSGTPPGSVTVYDSNNAIGTAPIGGSGAISYKVASIAKGSHSYRIGYAGSSNYSAANSASSNVTAK